MAISPRRLLAVAVLGACATVAGAQQREQLPIQLEAQSQDLDFQKGILKFETITITQGQIRITTEHAVASGLDFEDSNWEFNGSVRMSMPDSAIASDAAKVRFAAGEIQNASVTGSPATFERKLKDEQAEGRANRIDYDLKRGTVELAGDAWLSDGKTEITGETLVYSTASQRVISREQVLITIQPGEPPAETPKPQP